MFSRRVNSKSVYVSIPTHVQTLLAFDKKTSRDLIFVVPKAEAKVMEGKIRLRICHDDETVT